MRYTDYRSSLRRAKVVLGSLTFKMVGGISADDASRFGETGRAEKMNDNPFPANGPIDLFGPGAESPQGLESDTDGARMNSQPLRQTVRINNPQGLHMRPAAAFAQMARQYESSVVVWHNQRSVNGKSWLDLMLLAAMPGADVILEVVGEDAISALPKLAELLAAEGIDDPLAGDFAGL